MIKFIKYEHHNPQRDVWVREDLKGRHREHCLCYSCQRFRPKSTHSLGEDPGEEAQKYKQSVTCPIADQVFNLCVAEDLVLPVWECPHFVLSQETRDRYLDPVEDDVVDTAQVSDG